MNNLPTPTPTITPANKEFWAATAEGRFQLQRCDSCRIVVWFPRAQCPSCWTDSLTTFNASGDGTLYSFTIVRKGQNVYKDAAPFVIAYVELTEGPRVMTNIVDCDPESLEVGMKVRMVFHDTGAGSALYRFVPVD